MRVLALTAALSLLVACGDGFHEVQQADTIEAYEKYIADNPTSRMMLQAETRLEELYLDEAKAGATLEGYDRYLERFPEGHYHERAMKEREELLYNWAWEQASVEGWEKYLENYGETGDKDRRKKARRLLEVARYMPHLELGEVRHERVNLAEDPDGPLNGDGFFVDVTNKGEQTVEHLRLTIRYLSDDGVVVGQDEWPLVSQNWGIPIEEERKVPMKPGEKRTWEWTTGGVDERWGGDTRMYVSSIGFSD